MKKHVRYLKKRLDKIYSILKKPAACYTIETFHKLRVAIKRLDAFFELTKFCSKRFKRKKMFKPFKVIFKSAGKVREFQIEGSMLKKHLPGSLVDYRRKLKKLQQKEQHHFFEIVNEMSLRPGKKFSRIAPHLNKISKRKFKNYIKKKQRKIESFLQENSLKPIQIHQLRKQLKKFQYNREILNSRMRYSPLFADDLLPDLLGKWHDYQTIINHVNSASRAIGVIPEEVAGLKKIRTRFTAISKLQLKKINVALSSL